eukprot:jgi/Picsp_1/2534/NSC_00765-R1_glu-trna amidotransferase subunit c
MFTETSVLRTGHAQWHARDHGKLARGRFDSAAGDGGAKGTGGLEKPDVRKLAEMAQLGITDAQVEEWGPQIEGIVGWFDQLQQVDVSNVAPALRGVIDDNIGNEDAKYLRSDEPVEYEARDSLLASAPDMKDGFVLVPKTTTEDHE